MLLLIVIAIAGTHLSGMAPGARSQKQKAQPRRGQPSVPDGFHRSVFLAVEQLQPAVQVLGQHCSLEPVGIHHPAIGGMSGQAGVVVGFLDEVLGRHALIVEPDGQIQRVIHVGHEDPVDIPRRIEEWVLLWLFVLFCPNIAQRQETVGLAPAMGPI